MCTCIYCMYLYLLCFVLLVLCFWYCFVCLFYLFCLYCHRVTTQLQLIIIITREELLLRVTSSIFSYQINGSRTLIYIFKYIYIFGNFKMSKRRNSFIQYIHIRGSNPGSSQVTKHERNIQSAVV
jgi:hypothetical protein